MNDAFFSKVVLGEFIHYTNLLISMRSSTQEENFSSATFIHVSKTSQMAQCLLKWVFKLKCCFRNCTSRPFRIPNAQIERVQKALGITYFRQQILKDFSSWPQRSRRRSIEASSQNKPFRWKPIAHRRRLDIGDDLVAAETDICRHRLFCGQMAPLLCISLIEVRRPRHILCKDRGRKGLVRRTVAFVPILDVFSV